MADNRDNRSLGNETIETLLKCIQFQTNEIEKQLKMDDVTTEDRQRLADAVLKLSVAVRNLKG